MSSYIIEQVVKDEHIDADGRIIPPDRIHEAVVDYRIVYERIRGRSPTVVQASGCFDLLHVGHVKHLEQAASFGDALVVSLNSDEAIERLKGPGRPIISLKDRLLVVASLRCVTFVTWFSEDLPAEIVKKIQPNIYVKGPSMHYTNIPEMDIVFKYGAFRCTSDYNEHTTSILERVKCESSSPHYETHTPDGWDKNHRLM